MWWWHTTQNGLVVVVIRGTQLRKKKCIIVRPLMSFSFVSFFVMTWRRMLRMQSLTLQSSLCVYSGNRCVTDGARNMIYFLIWMRGRRLSISLTWIASMDKMVDVCTSHLYQSSYRIHFASKWFSVCYFNKRVFWGDSNWLFLLLMSETRGTYKAVQQ